MSSEFPFIANHLALDFINTMVWGTDGPVDLLADADALGRWIVAAGLPVPEGGVGDQELTEAIELREAARGVLDAWKTAGIPAEHDRETINQALRRPRPVPLLSWQDGKPLRRIPNRANTVHDALWLIADSTAELLCQGDRQRLKDCGNHECVLIFLDTSRNGSRRWCSMTTCGNRSKAARHYRRSRRES